MHIPIISAGIYTCLQLLHVFKIKQNWDTDKYCSENSAMVILWEIHSVYCVSVTIEIYRIFSHKQHYILTIKVRLLFISLYRYHIHKYVPHAIHFILKMILNNALQCQLNMSVIKEDFEVISNTLFITYFCFQYIFFFITCKKI